MTDTDPDGKPYKHNEEQAEAAKLDLIDSRTDFVFMRVPIYDAKVWLVVTPDIVGERAKPEWVELFGPEPVDSDWDAVCCRNCSKFALFFKPDAVDITTVAHEAFHLTHRILEWVGANFDSAHHETAALLNGYLLNRLFVGLDRLKAPVTMNTDEL